MSFQIKVQLSGVLSGWSLPAVEQAPLWMIQRSVVCFPGLCYVSLSIRHPWRWRMFCKFITTLYSSWRHCRMEHVLGHLDFFPLGTFSHVYISNSKWLNIYWAPAVCAVPRDVKNESAVKERAQFHFVRIFFWIVCQWI